MKIFIFYKTDTDYTSEGISFTLICMSYKVYLRENSQK